jgi:hypothetical protein
LKFGNLIKQVGGFNNAVFIEGIPYESAELGANESLVKKNGFMVSQNR